MKRVLFTLLLSALIYPNICFAEYTFGENRRIHEDPDSRWQSKYGATKSLVYANGVLYATWAENSRDIYVAKSTDNGETFSQVRAYADQPSTGVMSLAADDTGQYVYVIWQGSNRMYIAGSSDWGETFGPRLRIDTSCSPYQGWNSVTVDKSGNVYVVWEERGGCGRPSGIYLAKSTDRGATFLPKTRVSPASFNRLALANDVRVDDAGNVYVAWMDNYWTSSRIIVSVSTDGGATFNQHRTVNTASYPQNYPQIISRGTGNIRVAWNDWAGNVYVSSSTDRGQSFSQPVIASNQRCGTANMTQDRDGNIFVACATNNNIYMAWSEDGGISFNPAVTVNDQLLPQIYGSAPLPSIAVSDKGQVFAAWTDTRNGNADIYFAASNIPAPTTPEEIIAIVEALAESGCITNQGVANSIISSMKNARKNLESSPVSAKNILEAAINKVEAQSGKKICAEAAAELIDYLRGIIEIM